MQPKRGRGLVHWNAGTWLVAHVACTVWLAPIGLALLDEAPGAPGTDAAVWTVAAAFAGSQWASWALWRRRSRLTPYLALQSLLLVSGLALGLALAGAARSEAPWVVEVGDRIRPLLMALPAAMVLLHVLEMACRPRQAEAPLLFFNSLTAGPGGERTRSKTLDSPCAGASVVVESWGEHHEGAEHTIVVLDRSVEGIMEFHATNGDAMFDARRPLLVIHDADLAVLLHYEGSRSAWHHVPPEGWSLSGVSFREEGLLVRTRRHWGLDPDDGVPGREQEEYLVPFEDLSPGLGPARDGRMPSACPPRRGPQPGITPVAISRE